MANDCTSVAAPRSLNIDIEPAPGVDLALDVRTGLPFDEVSYIFAEHFIESI